MLLLQLEENKGHINWCAHHCITLSNIILTLRVHMTKWNKVVLKPINNDFILYVGLLDWLLGGSDMHWWCGVFKLTCPWCSFVHTTAGEGV